MNRFLRMLLIAGLVLLILYGMVGLCCHNWYCSFELVGVIISVVNVVIVTLTFIEIYNQNRKTNLTTMSIQIKQSADAITYYSRGRQHRFFDITELRKGSQTWDQNERSMNSDEMKALLSELNLLRIQIQTLLVCNKTSGLDKKDKAVFYTFAAVYANPILTLYQAIKEDNVDFSPTMHDIHLGMLSNTESDDSSSKANMLFNVDEEYNELSAHLQRSV